ncbi:MAG TPA: CaiB/BaiF CoA-transferase family protein, partial [Vicinamibacteria bacterium]
YDRLREVNPRIIYAFGTGFGKSGPYAHKGGQDVLAQAMTGVMARKADPAHPLAIYATALADYSAAMHLVQGVLLALLQREKTGKGQMVDVSLYDSMLSMQTQEASMWLMRREELNWASMPLSGVFETKDGALVLVGAFKENPLRDISTALEIEDLSREDRFSTMERMKEHRAELQGIFRKRFREGTTAHWIERLEAQDLLCSPVKSLSEALDDPQTAENGMLMEAAGRSETVRMVGAPVHLSEAAVEVRQAPPRLGEHTEAVLRELGYDSARIEGLRRQGVVA